MRHIYDAQLHWVPLYKSSPLYDNRLLSDPNAFVFWVAPAVEVPVWQKPAEAWDDRFKPQYSPMEMIRRGVFGGSYFGGMLGHSRHALLPTYKGVPIGCKGDKPQYRKSNYHGAKSGLSREWWLDKGLIYDFDPLGWFEWYCWYWLGRRIARYDDWQIQRWISFGVRNKPMLYANPDSKGWRQALLQWSHYDQIPRSDNLVEFGP